MAILEYGLNSSLKLTQIVYVFFLLLLVVGRTCKIYYPVFLIKMCDIAINISHSLKYLTGEKL